MKFTFCKTLTFFCCLSFCSCSIQKLNRLIQKDLKAIESKHRNHMGLLVVDIESQKTVLKYKEKNLFVPASNMKITTLYAALENLGDSLAMFKYSKNGNDICIKGTGNPTLLHPHFDNTKTLEFLKKAENITYDSTNFIGPAYAPGWAWEDYADYYQAEISSLPVFGNVVWINYKNLNSNVLPSIFEKNTSEINSKSASVRELRQNVFYNNGSAEQQIPFISSAKLNASILGQKVSKKIALGTCENTSEMLTFYGNKADTVYRKMMFESDNMLAEHVLLQAGQKYTDTISTALAIKKIRSNLMPAVSLRWVDGAGLSRYNLINPEGLVFVLKGIEKKMGFEKAIGFFPQAGVNGTLKNAAKQSLSIFAKSGSVGGVYNQSGYMISKSGKRLIFSFMSNNSLSSTSKVRGEMMLVLEKILANY
jgi:serine-type D-Ala-D-Ala carboxypeptidase/endopeptidase (penicillin-binding protein 4)